MAIHNAFISYSHASEDVARALFDRLEAENVKTFPNPATHGGVWRDQVQKGLEEAEVVILLLSPEAMRSPSVNFELGVALSRARVENVRVIPVMLPGMKREELPRFLRPYAIIDGNSLSPDQTA